MHFFKYHGTGNDFVMIDLLSNPQYADAIAQLTPARVAQLCHRHFGIGADGLIALTSEAGYHFKMHYYNADGHLASFCGNGSRCSVALAQAVLDIPSSTPIRFFAADGPHTAHVLPSGTVSVSMKHESAIEQLDPGMYYTNTGSPHVIIPISSPEALALTDVQGVGSSYRNLERFKPTGGTNVNFVAITENGFHIRTYERGVEAETLSCGTGVTAAALWAIQYRQFESPITVYTPGGKLQVISSGSDVQLCGPATKVFEGNIE
jgi:diaminopimelate epimerase